MDKNFIDKPIFMGEFDKTIVRSIELVNDQTNFQVSNQVWDQVENQVRNRVRNQVKAQIITSCLNNVIL